MKTSLICATLFLAPLTAQSATPAVKGVGSAFPGITGMSSASDGSLWVGSGLAHRIFHVFPNWTYDTCVDTSAIDDLVVVGDTVFGTALLTGEIRAIDTDTCAQTTVASGLVLPNPIIADTDGTLIVGGGDSSVPSTCFLRRIDPTGVLSPVDLVPPGTLCPNSMDWLPDGRIVVPDWGLTQDLLAIDPDTGAIEILATGLESPTSAKFCDGSIYVLDQRADGDDGGEIFEVLPAGLVSVAKVPPNQDSIVCHNGGLLLSSAEDGAIRKIVHGHTIPITLPGNSMPGGIVIDGSDLHSSAFFASRIVHREIFPGLFLPIPSKTVHGGFVNPNPPYGFIYRDLNGDLVGGAWFAGRTSTMDIDTGEALSSTPAPGIANEIVAPNGDVIQAFIGFPGLVFNATTSTVIATPLNPSGLGVLSTGEVVWSDTDSGTITVDGDTPISVGLWPEGLAITDDDQILVIVTGTGDLVEVDPVSRVVTTIATDTFYDVTPVPSEGLPFTNWLSILTPAVDGCDVYAWGFEQSSHTWIPSWKLYHVDRC